MSTTVSQPVSQEVTSVWVTDPEVQPSYERLPTREYQAYLQEGLQMRPEAAHRLVGPVVAGGPGANALMEMLIIAYDRHLPVVLSPDAIWLVLAQGVAQIINQHAEDVRKAFVSHDGQLTLQVRRDEFALGSPDNDWPGVFGEFSQQLKGHLGDSTHGLFVADFSTTDPVSRAASEIVLMESMKAYFQYVVVTCCGIPAFQIQGTEQDWADMQHRLGALAPRFTGLGYGDWFNRAHAILEEFIQAVRGTANLAFWKDFCKERSMGSGTANVTGHVLGLFPYLVEKHYRKPSELIRNVTLIGQQRHTDLANFPPSCCSTPFIWKYYSQELPYRFVAGLLGIDQREDSALSARIGWAVCPESA